MAELSDFCNVPCQVEPVAVLVPVFWPVALGALLGVLFVEGLVVSWAEELLFCCVVGWDEELHPAAKSKTIGTIKNIFLIGV